MPDTNEIKQAPESGSDAPTCSAMPPEFSAALYDLYSKYSSTPTNAQKINILITVLGDCGVSYIGMWKDGPEEHERMKLSVMEMDYLEHIGLHKPEFF